MTAGPHFSPGRVAIAWRALEVERAARLSARALEALQWQRLRSLLEHAQTRSPFYRERFREAGLAASDVRSPEDLRHLPPTTREDLRDPEPLLAEGFDRARLRRSTTSGSTGRRTTTYFDALGWATGRVLLKARARMLCGLRPWHRVALFQEGREDGPGRRLRRRSFPITRPCEEILEEVRRYAPDAVYGFPSYLVRLGRAAQGSLRPRAVFTSGEMLDPATRRAIEASFDAPVLDVYGCTEAKEIAWQCPRRGDHHVNADWLVVEQLEAGNEDDGAGGPLAVTCLYNRAMPLVRYVLGDTGRLVDGTCPCGLPFPLLRPGLGRSVDYFLLPDGRTVAPYAMTCAIEGIEGMLQYRLVQETRERVVVEVVPDDRFGDSAEREIRAALAPVLPRIGIDVRRRDRLEREPSGKFRVVASNLLPEERLDG